jgi:hypothetical protein
MRRRLLVDQLVQLSRLGKIKLGSHDVPAVRAAMVLVGGMRTDRALDRVDESLDLVFSVDFEVNEDLVKRHEQS